MNPHAREPGDLVLIAYDGSENADHAIEVAAALFGGGRAEIVHAWEPVSSAAARSAVYAIGYDDSPELLEEETGRAEAVAARGIERARAAGFDAAGGALSGSGPVWATIVRRADELRPGVVIMGTRGLTGLRSALAGSVSHAVSSHSAFPVLTVPLPESSRPED